MPASTEQLALPLDGLEPPPVRATGDGRPPRHPPVVRDRPLFERRAAAPRSAALVVRPPTAAAPARATNLVVRSADGRDQPCAKVVVFRGVWVLHAYAYPRFRRYDIGAWGLNARVLAWAARRGIRTVYLYDPANDRTLAGRLDDFYAAGIPGEDDGYGGNLNLADAHWRHVGAGRLPVPWVADSIRTVCTAAECVSASEGDD